MNQREAFEKWVIKAYGYTDYSRGELLDKFDDGEYTMRSVSINWDAWQAATEQGAGEATVPMPTTVAQAKGMALVGASWLEANAPEELKPTGGGVPEGWSFKKQGDSILVQYHENGGFVKGRWIDKQSERFSFEFFDALLATQQPPEQE